MATTTNYGWETPDDTDLVKDGASAIRTLGSSIDTTTKNLNPQTTTGALAYRSSVANVNTALPIGTAGQVLTVNSGATAPEWATPATPTSNFTLINAGGTALTGAATITVSSISAKNKLRIVIQSGSSANASSEFRLRFNTDSTTKYDRVNWLYNGTATNPDVSFATDTYVDLGQMGNNASNTVSVMIDVDGCNATGLKVGSWTSYAGGTSYDTANGHFTYSGTSTISSVSLISSTGNFDAGTIYVYGA